MPQLQRPGAKNKKPLSCTPWWDDLNAPSCFPSLSIQASLYGTRGANMGGFSVALKGSPGVCIAQFLCLFLNKEILSWGHGGGVLSPKKEPIGNGNLSTALFSSLLLDILFSRKHLCTWPFGI